MKTILTTFAIAVMVFAFNTDAFAGEKAEEKPKPKPKVELKYDPKKIRCSDSISGCVFGEAESNDGLDGRDVADSGNEGPTSAAQESDQ